MERRMVVSGISTIRAPVPQKTTGKDGPELIFMANAGHTGETFDDVPKAKRQLGW
jgi:hypothetical protein